MKKIVEQTDNLNTIDTLKKDLLNLGVGPGMTLLVHSSLSSMGWVNGGGVAVAEALMDVVTAEGTIVMPAQSSDWSDPSEWESPAVPEGWWSSIRDTMPVYHPQTTPTSGMGKIVEVFRTYPGVIRSDHPAVSFAAWGKNKAAILSNHQLDFGLGEQSPLARLYERNASVLFIGTDYQTNTCFHLGEYRAPHYKIEKKGAPIIEAGKRVWKEYQEIVFEVDIFNEIGQRFEASHQVKKGKIGQAKSRLFLLSEAVDFSEQYFTDRRSQE
ncbi:aminoglycoside N(3)-acetyltransferase [Amphibacillus sediminis]|uniref:aminoglycoside N(3)-acetyltransferase n=1 Tax=Amphibacillus sediminis TaxID=360185 RepID=UPI00082D8CD1|nr:AAC(3) family N-acetyltransferase [Amphibacillus sediminis]